jgi:hypothetical protein
VCGNALSQSPSRYISKVRCLRRASSRRAVSAWTVKFGYFMRLGSTRAHGTRSDNRLSVPFACMKCICDGPVVVAHVAEGSGVAALEGARDSVFLAG